MVDGARLESVFTVKGNVGSNPIPSAISINKPIGVNNGLVLKILGRWERI